MPYYNVKDFQRGLDTRRMVETTEAGSLIRGKNIVITRGGEIERRKAFLPVRTLPADTFGLYVDDDSQFHVWHTVATPAPVDRVIYHKLTHPDGLALKRIRIVRWFGKEFFVVAMFENNKNLSYWGEKNGEGVLVVGTPPPATVDPNGGIAILDPGASVDLPAMVQLTGAWNNGDTATIDMTVGTEFYSTTVAILVDDSTSTAVAAAFTEPQHLGAIPLITPTSNGNVITITPDPGVVVTVTNVTKAILNPDPPVVIEPPVIGQGRAYIDMTIQVVSDVGGVLPRMWTLPPPFEKDPRYPDPIWQLCDQTTVEAGFKSSAEIAILMADAINNFVPNPNSGDFPPMTASTSGAHLYISFDEIGPQWNYASVTLERVNPVLFTSTPDPAFYINGRNEDDNTLLIDGVEATKVDHELFSPGRYALQHRYKMFAVSADGILRASALNNPLYWNPAYTGAGTIDFTQSGGTHDSNLQSLAIFQDKLAIFAANAVHIWNMDPDLAQSNERAILHNTGTFAQRSVAEYGNTDVFYLDQSGIRSLNSRDVSGEAFSSDVGNPIDDLVREAIKGFDVDSFVPVAEIEPSDGRYVLFVGSHAFVFSFFSKTKIAAWSIWETDFIVKELSINSARMYARGDDNVIYSYGLEGSLTREEDYDDCECDVQLPYLHAEKPATQKDIFGMDVAVQNTWNVEFGIDYSDSDLLDQAGIVSSTTFRYQRLPIQTYSTHISFRLKCTEPGYARIGGLVFHFRDGEEPG